MIKFFRKIRQQLLSENKISKYLVYAFGEIILVVVGILIALQINNWNADAKERTLEMEMLQELYVAIQGDLEDVEYNLKTHQSIFKSQKIVLEWLDNEEGYTDSLSFHFFNMVHGTNFLSNTGPYETLKGIGVHLIENDSLRGQVLNLYEGHYKNYRGAMNQVNNYRKEIINNKNEAYFQATSPYFPMKPLDVKKIKREYGFCVKTLASYNKYFTEEKIGSTKNAIEAILKALEQELEKRK